MRSVELREEGLAVDREPTRLDDLALTFSACLRRCDIRHAYISDYVPHLAGRTRSMDSIAVLVEVLDEETATSLATILREAGFWGGPLPLSSLDEMLTSGEQVWLAPTEYVTPHIEMTIVSDEFDSAVLEHAITAELPHGSLSVSPIELQIAYKLHLDTEQDFDDARYLYTTFSEDLHVGLLKTWVARLGVEELYTQLSSATNG